VTAVTADVEAKLATKGRLESLKFFTAPKTPKLFSMEQMVPW
jgi:hypothetical protein